MYVDSTSAIAAGVGLKVAYAGRAIASIALIGLIWLGAGLVAPARADTIIDGTTSSATRYDRRASNDVDSGCRATSVAANDGRDVDYASVAIHVTGDAPRALDVEMLPGGTTIIDPVLSVYCYFNPLFADLDLIMVEDDTAGSLFPRIDPARGVMLQPGHTYVLVIAPFSHAYLGSGGFRLRLGDGFAPGPAPPIGPAVTRPPDLGREDMHRTVGLIALIGARALFDHARDGFDGEMPLLVAGDGIGLTIADPGNNQGAEPGDDSPQTPATAVFAHSSDSDGVFSAGNGDQISGGRVRQVWVGARTGLDPDTLVGGAVGYEMNQSSSYRANVDVHGNGWQGLAFVEWRGLPGVGLSAAVGGGRFDYTLLGFPVFGLPPVGGSYDGWRAMGLGAARVRIPVLGQPVSVLADAAVFGEWLDGYTDTLGQRHDATHVVVGEAGLGVRWQGDMVVAGELVHPRVGVGLRWRTPIRAGASSLAGSIRLGSSWTVAEGVQAIGDWTFTVHDDGRSATQSQSAMVRLNLDF